MRFDIGPVSRPVLSVGEILEHGSSVLFSAGGSCIVKGVLTPPEAATKIDLVKHGRTFWLGASRVPGKQAARMLAPLTEGGSSSSSGQAVVAAPPSEPAGANGQGAIPADIVPGPEATSAEAIAPRAKVVPIQPSAEEIQKHNLTHRPFRAWCSTCVRAFARDDAHWRVHREPDELPRVELDFAFLSKVDEALVVSVLVVVDCHSGAIAAVAVPKAVDRFIVAFVVGCIDSWGRTRVILLTDQEPAVELLASCVRDERKHETVVRAAPRYSSKSKGTVERANAELEGQVRAIWLDMEKYKVTLPVDHPLLTWATRHAAWTITRFLVKEDGATAYRRLYSKEYTGEVAQLAECVWFRVPNRQGVKLEVRWEAGLWLGKSEKADEHLICCGEEVVTARSINRRPEAERSPIGGLEGFCVTPWFTKNKESAAGPPRRRYITKAMVDQYGRTKGCRACHGLAQAHDELCRKRFEAIWAAELKKEKEVIAGVAAVQQPLPLEDGSGEPGGSQLPASASEVNNRQGAIPADLVHGPEADHGAMDVASSEGVPFEGVMDAEMLSMMLPAKRELRVIGGREVDVLENEELIACLFQLGDPEMPEAHPDEILDSHSWLSLVPEAVVYDSRTGEILSKPEVQKVREKDIHNMEGHDVYDLMPESEAYSRGWKPIKGKWVNDKKADGVRSRFVAMQVNYYAREDVQANTPPIKAGRIIISKAACRREQGRLVAIYDVSVAFFHAELGENVVVKGPPGICPPGVVMRLKRALYGTRKAGQMWQELIYEVFEAAGFTPVAVLANTLYSRELDVEVTCHGDDFLAGGGPASLDKLDVIMENHFQVKKLGRVGPGAMSSAKFLKREISHTEEGFRWLGDVRHVDKLVKELHLEDCKPAPTPGTKTTGKSRDALDALDKAEASDFRRWAGLALYISADRWDIMYACKAVMAGMSTPTVADMARLKRLARYLRGHPELYWCYPYQEAPRQLVVWADSDWCGEEATRRSTSACIETFGSHPLDCCSVTQSTVSLSSGEAELKAINRAAAGGIQTREVMEAMGMGPLELWLLSDSSAGRAMVQRRGAGKVRHLEAKELWLQEKVRRKQVVIKATRSEDNIADLGTKYLEEERAKKLVAGSGMQWSKGSMAASLLVASSLAVQANGQGAIPAELVREASLGLTVATKLFVGWTPLMVGVVAYLVVIHLMAFGFVLMIGWRFWPAKSKPEEKKARGALETILQRFTVEELKAELRLRHHGVTGVKTVLVSRLAATKPWAAGNQIETILSLLGQNSYLTVRLEDVVSTERAGDWLRQAKVKRT